jgi:hypothetical protein
MQTLFLVLVLTLLTPATECGTTYESSAFVTRAAPAPKLLKIAADRAARRQRLHDLGTAAMNAHVNQARWTAAASELISDEDNVARTQRCSRRRSLLAVAAACTVLKPAVASSAVSIRAVKKAIVNIVRVRQGALLLEGRLDENLLDGFQDGIKLLAMDTDLRNNVKVACEGLSELGLESRQQDAEYRADRVVQFLSQIVEYDGWDKMNRMDIREKFQQMTPEKIKFAKKGFTEVIWLLDLFLDFVIINVLFCCVL